MTSSRRSKVMGVLIMLTVGTFLPSGLGAATSLGLSTRLLSTNDLAGGWHASRLPVANGECDVVPSVDELTGKTGVGVAFARFGGSQVAAEYLVNATRIYTAFEDADNFLSLHYCGYDNGSGGAGSSSLATEINVPLYGDWSIGELVTVRRDGVRSQIGFVLARKSHRLLIVAYENRGSLQRNVLDGLAQRAYRKMIATPS